MRASALRRLMRRAQPTAASVQAVCSGRRAPHAALPPAGRCGLAGRSITARTPTAAAAERLPPPLRASVPAARALAAVSQGRPGMSINFAFRAMLQILQQQHRR
jgi:hypothetical protein